MLTGLQNGVGAFVLQCKQMNFHYCDWAGSSKGMKYVRSRLSSPWPTSNADSF
jgi:large subunit ribosomal protein L43